MFLQKDPQFQLQFPPYHPCSQRLRGERNEGKGQGHVPPRSLQGGPELGPDTGSLLPGLATGRPRPPAPPCVPPSWKPRWTQPWTKPRTRQPTCHLSLQDRRRPRDYGCPGRPGCLQIRPSHATSRKPSQSRVPSECPTQRGPRALPRLTVATGLLGKGQLLAPCEGGWRACAGEAGGALLTLLAPTAPSSC